MIKKTHGLSIEFHVYFSGGTSSTIWATLSIHENGEHVADARTAEIFGDDRLLRIFEERDAETHLNQIRIYIDQVCTFADSVFTDPKP